MEDGRLKLIISNLKGLCVALFAVEVVSGQC